MESEFAIQNYEVLKSIYNDTFEKLDEIGDMNISELNDIITLAFEKVSKERKVNISTVQSKISTQMGISTEKYRDLVLEFLNGNRDELIECIVDNSKHTKDSPVQIRKAFRDI